MTESENGINSRSIRAATEYMSVLEEADDLYLVVSESGKSYTVDLREPACTCPDFHHRQVHCKHIRRAQIETDSQAAAQLYEQLESQEQKVVSEAERVANLATDLRTTSRRLRKARTRLEEIME